MKKGLLFICTVLLVVACHKEESSQPAANTPAPAVEQEIAAAVRAGKETITPQDIQAALDLLSDKDRKFAQTSMGHQNLLQILLREKLIAADAKANKLEQNEGYQELLAKKRAQLDAIYDEYAAQLLENLWYETQREKGLISVSDEEIKEYYKKYPYEMTVKQIILDNAETADQVLRTLKRSPSKWKDMSRQYSIAPEVIRDNSFSFMPGEFLPEIEVIAANSSNGSVQGFIKTGQGFHIIMKTSEKRLSRTEAEPRIRAVLEQKKLDKVLEDLQNKYEVIIYDKTE